jgi:hypothetical protein
MLAVVRMSINMRSAHYISMVAKVILVKIVVGHDFQQMSIEYDARHTLPRMYQRGTYLVCHERLDPLT